MKHLKVGRKFSRKTGPRKALLKSLAANLFLKEKIKTTEAKAKDLRMFAERHIEVGKRAGVLASRELSRFYPKRVVKKVITQIAPQYKDRKGGYTRIIKLNRRKSDGAKMAFIELVK